MAASRPTEARGRRPVTRPFRTAGSRPARVDRPSPAPAAASGRSTVIPATPERPRDEGPQRPENDAAATERRLRLARTALLALGAVLALVLVVSIVKGLTGGEKPTTATSATSSSASPSASQSGSTVAGSAAGEADEYDGDESGVGPTSTAVPTSGSGTFTALDVPGAQSTASGRVVRYAIEVEDGIPADRALFAKTVREALLDPRGWQAQDKIRFVNVSAKELTAGAKVDVRIRLATPKTVDRLCAPLRTLGRVSCHNGAYTVLNLLRWETGAEAYGKDVARYRLYLVNHEVGHAIGHNHAGCPKPGAPAPVMLQQTLGLKGCTVNTWPTVTKG